MWPLDVPVSFRRVWWCVVSKGSSLDFLIHSVIGAPCSLGVFYFLIIALQVLWLPHHCWFVGVFPDLWWVLLPFEVG